jgi:hypothetical protein
MDRPASDAPPARGRFHASPYLLLSLTPLFWAANWVIGRSLHHDIPPMGMTFFRWLFAIAILAPFALPHVRRDAPLLRRHGASCSCSARSASARTTRSPTSASTSRPPPTASSSTRSSR